MIRRLDSIFRRFGLAGAVAFLAGVPASAQTPQRSFGETVEVRVINVEAVVTERGGRRVHGLGPEEFELYVDGEAVPIAFFDEIRDGRVLRGSRGSPEADEPVRTNYLLFVDACFGASRDRRQVLESIRDDLAALGPADRVAAVGFDGRRLLTLSDWAPADGPVGAALEVAAGGRASSLAAGEAGIDASSRNVLLADRLRRTYAAVAEAMRGHASVPGRRVLMLLAGGWPRDLYVAREGVGVGGSPLWNLREDLERLADTANLTGFTIYAVDVPGRETGPALDVDSRLPPDVQRAMRNLSTRSLGESWSAEDEPSPEDSAIQALEFQRRRFVDGAGREHEREATLLELAKATGGEAWINSQRLGALARTVDDTRSYYWLGFSLERQGDDRHRSIEVRLAGRRGLEVRTRDGYTDISRATEADLLAAATLLEGEVEDVAALSVELGAARRTGRRSLRVPFTIRIPLDAIATVDRDRGLGAVLELRIAALDAAGRRSEVSVLPIELTFDAQAAAGSQAEYEAAVLVRDADQQLAFTLVDPTSGTVLSSRVDLDVGERPGPEI